MVDWPSDRDLWTRPRRIPRLAEVLRVIGVRLPAPRAASTLAPVPEALLRATGTGAPSASPAGLDPTVQQVVREVLAQHQRPVASAGPGASPAGGMAPAVSGTSTLSAPLLQQVLAQIRAEFPPPRVELAGERDVAPTPPSPPTPPQAGWSTPPSQAPRLLLPEDLQPLLQHIWGR